MWLRLSLPVSFGGGATDIPSLQPVPGTSFYHHLILVFRSMLKQAIRLENAQILPGDLVATTNKYSGCAFPKGIVAGAAVHMTDGERLKLVHLFDNGAGRALCTWDVVLPVLDN